MSAYRLAALLATISLLSFLALLPFRAPLEGVWGDEGTYLAMAESLAEDFDLRFDDHDLSRLENASPGRSTVILQSVGQSYAYSKPIFFSLCAAPFFALFGIWGPGVLNALALALALVLAHAYLCRFAPARQVVLVLVTFVCASVLLPYVLWRMSDLFQCALTLAGLVLCFGHLRPIGAASPSPWQRLLDWHGAPWLGAVLLGLLTSMRLSNGALAAIPVIAALFDRRVAKGAALALSSVAVFGLMLGVTSGLTGSTSPYRAVRTSFNADTGYPVGPHADQAAQRFQEQRATVVTSWQPSSDPYRVAYATLYFFVGRHASFIFYFPAGFVFLLLALRYGDRRSYAMLLGFGGFVAFYLGWLPWNFFGGDTFIGNRYLLPAYPVLLVALRRLPGPRLLLFAWLLAAISMGSAALSVAKSYQLDRSSQNHASAGIFRLLPYESIAPDIAGRRDRYWSGHFVRFVDPFAKAAPWHFELDAGRPAAEILIAHWQPLDKLQLLVKSSRPGTHLTVSDRRHRQTFALDGETEQRIEITLAPAWRRHLFWWDQTALYYARTLRLELSSEDGQAAQAEIRYLGAESYWDDAFSYTRLTIDVPERAPAGASTTARIRLRNTSPRTWQPHDVFPVYAKYRLYKAEEPDQKIFESRPVRLKDPIPPGGELDLDFVISWPLEPGSYLLKGDLILSRLAWFQNRIGEPVLRQTVTVEAAPEGS